MILSCPACQARYVVPDSAIGANGRQVRCAACKTSWFQQAGASRSLPEAERAAIAMEPTPAATSVIDRPFGDAPPDVPPSFRPISSAIGPEDDRVDYDPFASEPPFAARRNPARTWTIVAIVAALLMLAAAAVMYFVPRSNAAQTAALTTPLVLEVTRKPERRQLESGNELLAVSGRISNPTDSVQPVPRIRAELRDAQGRIVYGWPISAPVPELQPRASTTFNSAEVDVPRGARRLSISFLAS